MTPKSKAFFKAKPRSTIEGPVSSRDSIRAAPVAQIRLRCLNPVGKGHRFKAAYKINCPVCQHQTVIIGPVQDPLTKRQGPS